MANDSQEFETKPSSSKDMWLFLIVLDVVFLCVFGFFLYKHFSGQLFTAATPTTPAAEEVTAMQVPEEPSADELQVEPLPVEEPEVQPSTPKEECSTATCKYIEGLNAYTREDYQAARKSWKEALQLDPSNPDAKLGLAKVEEILAENQTMLAATAPQDQSVKPLKNTQETKQSIVITPTAGKYRRVTFRWFGEGEQVAVVSGFTMSKPQSLKKVGGHWETTLSIAPGTYKFLYIIDGKNTLDPYAQEKDGRSVLIVK